MLETRCSGREFERSCVVATVGDQSVDQTSGKGVARTDSVDDVRDFVRLTGMKLFSIVQHCMPSILVCARPSPQRDGENLEIRKLLEHTLTQCSILLDIH